MTVKLLIADDDEWICEGLKRNIDWSGAGVELVGTASDGEAAWELALELTPDIVLTDIRMPFMDGLELAAKLRELSPRVKTIFLTGYDDFNYAKQALNLQAFDYILKYEDNGKILQTVVAAGERLLRERQEEEKLSKSRTLMENQLFAHLFEGCFNGEWVSRELELLGLKLCGNDFQVAVIRPENLMRYSRSADYEEIDLLLFSIRNVCTELLVDGGDGGAWPQCFFAVYNRQANLVFCLPQPGAAVELLPLLERTRRALAQVLKIPFSIGLGGCFSGYDGIAASYREALAAVQVREVAGEPGVFVSGEILSQQSSHQLLLKKMEAYIHAHLCDESLSLTAIAAAVHISPPYVSTLFKKYKQVNLVDYIISARMERAAEMLVKTDFKAYEIAEKTGYSNPHYFSVLFKKHHGLSPTDYRKKHQPPQPF
ncbi:MULTISPECIES: response regulator [Paenibacillus]|uniref:response regulator n=1 Tax=Paenibacillus TaxID=44249 RepID=UPI002432117D|nr:response regulator [Paenibacillus macerans]MBS5909517.1 response regulator [Paenibacillus macerans]